MLDLILYFLHRFGLLAAIQSVIITILVIGTVMWFVRRL